MKTEGFASVWFGSLESKDSFERYVRIDYSEDGDAIRSTFQKNFGIGQIDPDFVECRFLEEPTTSISKLIGGHSYGEQLVPAVSELTGDVLSHPVNWVVLLYDFRFEKLPGTATGKPDGWFAGSVRFQKDR